MSDHTDDAWEAASVMMGPVKESRSTTLRGMVPSVYLREAAAWFSDPANHDWGIMDIVYSPSVRILNGIIQAALVLYVQDRMNQVAPIQVLDEPFMKLHDHGMEMIERTDDPAPGMAGMLIDPRWLQGTRAEAVQTLRDHGVPDFVIELLLPEREGEE